MARNQGRSDLKVRRNRQDQARRPSAFISPASLLRKLKEEWGHVKYMETLVNYAGSLFTATEHMLVTVLKPRYNITAETMNR